MTGNRHQEENNKKSCTKKEMKNNSQFSYKISLRTIKQPATCSSVNVAVHISRMVFGLG